MPLKIKTAFLAFLFFSVLVTVFVYSFIFMVVDSISKVDSAYDARLGTEVVLAKDTLKVIDYSLVDKHFILTDGTKVNSSLILDKELNKVINLNKK